MKNIIRTFTVVLTAYAVILLAYGLLNVFNMILHIQVIDYFRNYYMIIPLSTKLPFTLKEFVESCINIFTFYITIYGIVKTYKKI